ncbi:hypothetical protein Q1695_011524 [Nippostrongylus brasiliensis]|nr:hypothetical protein Q1695_011524 [Nippostrongylus brasiliensis]
MSSDSAEVKSADFKIKVVHALRGKNVSKNYYEVLPFTIELQKGQSLGLVIKKDIVVGVKWDSPCLGIIRAGDILYTINRQIFHDDTGKTKDLLSQITQNGGKPKVNVIRFKRRPRMKPFLPKGYEPVEGFDYEWTVLYLMRGMPLGLDVRLIDKKVYVANLLPDSIAAMSLLIGECIVDVEGEPVKSIPQMTSTMVKMLDLKGQVRLLVEFPANDMLRNMIRAKIAAAVGPPEQKDLPVPLEARPWAEKGLAALKEKDPKPIYKESKGDKKKEDSDEKTNKDNKPKNTSFNEKTVEHSYYDDLQTQLIVKVPPPRTAGDNNEAGAPS